ncbi:MAG: hypothetical protein ACE5SW_08400 [Nitrososphaeraceae archaeon]
MPHVVFSGNISFKEVFQKLEKIFFKDSDNNLIIRVEEYFMNKYENIILAKTISVDRKTQSFYIMLMKKEDKITIRLDPITDPDKTEGVKTAIALISKTIKEYGKSSNLNITKTNVQEFINKVQSTK